MPMPMQHNNVDAAGYDVPPQVICPVGIVFKPTDVELLHHYLRKKLTGELPSAVDYLIKERDIYHHDPHNLLAPGESFPFSKDNEMYFFSKRRRTSSRSNRVDRNTPGGFWDCRSRDYAIENGVGQVIGHRVQFTFNALRQSSLKKRNRSDKTKTDWLMQEYRLKEQEFDAMVLCKIYNKDVAPGAGNNEGRGQRVEDQAMVSPPLTSSADVGYIVDQPPSSSASALVTITSVCDDGYSQFLTDDDLGTPQLWDEYFGDDAFVLDELTKAQTTLRDNCSHGAVAGEENGVRALKRQRVLKNQCHH